MKSSSFPSLRVEPELREAAESVLRDGETLTNLIETSVRETIQRRRVQEEFIARGWARAKTRSGQASTTPLSPFIRSCSDASMRGGSRSWGERSV